MSEKIEELPFSKKTQNALKRAGVTNGNRLRYFIRKDKLDEIWQLGAKGKKEICEWAAKEWAKI